MRVSQVTVSRSIKVNTGNYESKDAFISMSVEIEPGDDTPEVIERAWASVQAQAHKQEDLIRKGDASMPIAGLTDMAPGFPEIGHVRKGAPKGANCPGKDLDYFRVEFNDTDTDSAERFRAIYGDKPRAIRVMLPYDDVDRCFDAWREAYSAGQLLHRCDGNVVHYPPSERGKPCALKDHKNASRCCKPVGRLRVIIPELARLGYLTVHTTSVYDIRNLSAGLRAIKNLAGRLTGVPMIIRRVKKEISAPADGGKRKRYTKWLLFIEVDPVWVEARLAALQETALLEASGGVLALGDGEDEGDEYIVDVATGEIVEALPEPRWTSQPARIKNFFAWARAQHHLGESSALSALGVAALADFTGTPAEAMQAVEKYAAGVDVTENELPADVLAVMDMMAIAPNDAIDALTAAEDAGIDVSGEPQEVAARVAEFYAQGAMFERGTQFLDEKLGEQEDMFVSDEDEAAARGRQAAEAIAR